MHTGRGAAALEFITARVRALAAFDETCATLLLVYLVTTGGRLDEDAIARTMNEMAWGHSDGSPIVRWDVFDVWNPLWWATGAVGPWDAATEESAWKRIPTPAARALVRDVFFPDLPMLS